MARRFVVPVGLVALESDPAGTFAGDTYFNTVSGKIRIYDGVDTWLDAGTSLQDVTDAIAGAAIANTDDLSEGTTNKYFTAQRVNDILTAGGVELDSPSIVSGMTVQGDITLVSATQGALKAFGLSGDATSTYYYSSDGTTWSSGTFPESAYWSHVVFGSGKYVALGTRGPGPWGTRIAYSTDGISWTVGFQTNNSNVNTSNLFYEQLAYGNGKFVAVGRQSNLYSTDGINWTSTTNPAPSGDYVYRSIAYGNSTFVSVRLDGQIITSTDGVTWSNPTSLGGFGYEFSCLNFVNDKFVVIKNGTTVKYSSNGTTWSNGSTNYSGSGANGTGVTYFNGTYLAVLSPWDGSSGATELTSSDGITWTQRTGIPASYRNNISKVGNAVVASVGNTSVYRSTNGVTWSLVSGTSVNMSFLSEVNSLVSVPSVLVGDVEGNADTATTLSGLLTTLQELNYLQGLTSNVQNQLDTIQTIQGATGAQGATGSQGTTGAQGATGTQGEIGGTGLQGSEGPQGVQGLQGDLGPQGVSGTQGTTGTQGATGLQGADGTQGANGSNGTQGETGAQGIQGATGTSGLQGQAGTQGETGTQGAIGAQGAEGIQGTTGAQGTQGLQGYAGADGNSSSYYNYNIKTGQTSGDPGNGYIIYNHATQTSATALIIDHLTSSSVDIDLFLSLLKEGDTLVIQDASDSDNYQQWTVNGAETVVPNNYVTVPVTLATSNGTGTTGFANNAAVILVIVASGIQGPTGAQGVQGVQGIQGLTGTISPDDAFYYALIF